MVVWLMVGLLVKKLLMLLCRYVWILCIELVVLCVDGVLLFFSDVGRKLFFGWNVYGCMMRLVLCV